MKTVVKQFMCCLNLKSLTYDEIEHLSWAEQAIFIQATIKHPLILRNPIKYSYQVAFLKRVIDLWESRCDEIHDDVYTTYCDLKSKKDEDFSFKHYGPFREDDQFISLKESSNLISQGTTGLHSWEASLVLSEWCINNKDMLHNKNLLELGSGAGLAGLVIAKCCQPNKMWLTDCHHEVLKLLTQNIILNSRKPSYKIVHDSSYKISNNRIHFRGKMEEKIEIGVLNLPWEDLVGEDFLSEIIIPDVILAADVVYDSSIFKDLCNAFEYFIKSNTQCIIILVCTIRNENTLDEFLKLLESHNHCIVTIKQPDPYHLCWPSSVDTKILKISNHEQ